MNIIKLKEREDMKELVINNIENKNEIMLIENYELVEKYEENEEDQSIEGNIYIGKVQNVLSGLQSAFIDIGEKKNAFIHVKDIMPKIDITKEEPLEEVPITTLVKPGDPIIVEVKRESTEYKGPKVSTHISLVGRFVVIMPNCTFITVSQKIEEKKERKRLKKIVKSVIPEGVGAIIRTVAENKKSEDICEDVKSNLEKWKNIQDKKIQKYPQKIYSKGGILKKTIIDLVDNDLDKIIVNNEKTKKKIEEILVEIGAKTEVELRKDCLKIYSLEKELSEIDNRKVWLKCGGFITIDKTEALTAIDVNSGKFIGSKDLEKTVIKVNLEAAAEIAKQLRLRDISGIIIIDFIDMKTEEHKQSVIQELLNHSKKDRSKIQVEEFTKLNLMEITRKHINSKK